MAAPQITRLEVDGRCIAAAIGSINSVLGMEFNGDKFRFVNESGDKSSELSREDCTADQMQAAIEEIIPGGATVTPNDDGSFCISFG